MPSTAFIESSETGSQGDYDLDHPAAGTLSKIQWLPKNLEGNRLSPPPKGVVNWTYQNAPTETSSDHSHYTSAVEISVHGDDEPPHKRRKPVMTEPRRLKWSDSESDRGGKAVHKKYTARRSVVRRKDGESGGAARTAKMEGAPSPTNHSTKNTKKKASKKRGRPEKVYEVVSSDEELMEWTVPSYLQKRRAGFDKRVGLLKQGGLKLPPSWGDVDFSDDENLATLQERPDFPTNKTSRSYKDISLPYSLGLIPAPIAQWLRDYQIDGVSFLHELFVYQKGGLLGDDMGLGKTIQVIAFLTAAYGKTGDERDKKRMRKMRRRGDEKLWYPRTLIICPGSLMANWQDELQRWGWWHSDLYHGSTATKESVLATAQAGMLEIMITTYTTYRMNKSAINMVSWDCVVADECHMFKERKSDIAKAMNEVNALCRIGLTGTAIQNKYEELWTLLNWTNPGRFGPITTWKASICEPLKIGQSHNASNYELARARKTAKSLVENLLPQFFLRRMKTLIKDQLPKKSDRVVFCPLTQTQAMAYENFLESDIVQCIKNSNEMCECGSGKKAGWCCHTTLEDGSKWQTWVFPAIANLQKLSNHLAILIPSGNDPKDKQAKDFEMLQIAMPDQWRELYASRDNIMNFANPEFCGKWRILRKLLKFWYDEGSNKVLVFSHSVRLLKMLQMLFTSTSYNVTYLDGSMKYEDRYATVTDFNTDPSQFVFLISTRAGGVGLNITSANKVVVVDPNWNPSYDLQAQDRAYRIGQTRDVEVFRLVSQGTLEEIVYARQVYKQQQANIGYNASSERRYFAGVQDRKEQQGEIFGLDNLFRFEGNCGSVVLRDILNKTNVAETRADVQVVGLELDTESEDEDEDEDPEAQVDDADNGFSQSLKTEAENADAAMSQLAAMIIGDEAKKEGKKAKTMTIKTETGKKKDPVQAILASAGVQYTHENSEVIGSSKVEERLSKRAQATAEDQTGTPQEQQAKVFVDESQNQVQGMDLTEHDGAGAIKYRYNPPEQVKRRQFCSMAKWAGYDDPVEYASVVEGWTQADRREVLSKFYRHRRDVLAGKQEVAAWDMGGNTATRSNGQPLSRAQAKTDDGQEDIDNGDDEL